MQKMSYTGVSEFGMCPQKILTRTSESECAQTCLLCCSLANAAFLLLPESSLINTLHFK